MPFAIDIKFSPLDVRFIHVPDAAVLAALSQLSTQMEQVMADLTALTAEVARNTDVDQSAITLLNGLSDQLHALATDPAAIRALADQLKGSSDSLAAAVAANTVAAP